MAAETEGDWALVEVPSLEALFAKCQTLSSQGDISEALAVAAEALELAKSAGKTAGEIEAMCVLAQLRRRSGDFGQALDTAKDLRKLCHSLKGHEEDETRALIEIARAHLSQHEGKPASRAAAAAVKLSSKAAGGQGAGAEVRVEALLVLAEAMLQTLVDYHGAVVKNERLQREIDDAGARAFDAVQEAAKICAHAPENPQEDEEEDAPQGQLVLHQQPGRDWVQDSRIRASAFYWHARVFVIFRDKEQEALAAAAKAKFLYQQVQDKEMEAESLLVMAQAYHKMDPSAQWASNAAHNALEIFLSEKNTAGKERTWQLFQELGITVRVAGGVAGAQLAVTAGETGAAPAAAAQAQSVVEKVKGLDPELVMQSVQEMAKAAIGLDEELFLDSPLMDSGMDSLTAVSFRNGLQQNLGVKLPSSLMFDYPTMKEVGNRIVELSLEED